LLQKLSWFPVSLPPTSHITSPNPKVKIRDMFRRLEAHIRLVSFPPFHGVFSPTTSQNMSSDQHRAYPTRLCYAFRFSQPRDALLRSYSHGLVSCRIRPWGCDFQRFPPSQSRHSLHCALPSAFAPPSAASHPLRSEERCFSKTLVSSGSKPLRRMSPIQSSIAMPGSGFVH
jgi:hypothetical protein